MPLELPRAERERRLGRAAARPAQQPSRGEGALPTEIEAGASGALWIDPRHRPALVRAGLESFTDFLATRQGTRLRELADRENWRLDLAGPDGPCCAYLKKHHIRTWKTRLRAWLRRGPGNTAGCAEARRIAQLAAAGIPTMRLVAFGEKLHGNGLLESFLLTEELAGFQQLDQFLRARFSIRDPAARSDPVLRRLIRDAARLARRFHDLGFNHRDFYCCHFFVRETNRGVFTIHLIDLQRVQHRRRLRSRWIVKDLAQLAYSAPRERIGCRERLAFLHAYFGVRKLLPAQRRLARIVLFKQRCMEWKLGPHP